MTSRHNRSRAASAAVFAVRALGVDLRSGETRVTFLLFFAFFFSLIFQYVGKTVRQVSFLDAYGAENLPWVYLFVPLVSFPALGIYEALLNRFRPAIVLALTAVATAASLVLFWWLFGLELSWVPFVFYLWVTIAIGLNLSLIWSVAGVTLDPRQARRLFGLLGAGAILGGIAGGQVARIVATATGVRSTLLAAAATLVVAASFAFVADSGEETTRSRGRSDKKSVRGVREVWESGLLRRTAGVLMLAMIAAQIVDLQFNWVVERATSGPSNRAAFFGNFYSVMGIAAALFQILWTSRIHRSLGVGFALRVLPTTLLAGTVVLVLASSFWPAVLIFAGLTLKVGENGIRYSLDQSTRELLFVPIPRDLRMRAKAVIDVLLQRGAKGLAALLLLPVALGWITVTQASWLNLAVIAIWLLFLPGLYREYVRAFRGRLDSKRRDEAIPIDFEDAGTLEILVESLGSADSRQVLHSLDLLASHGRGRLVPPLLLYHDEPEVRTRTLSVLASSSRADALPLIERRLSDDHADVRAAAIHVVAHLRHEAVGDLMVPKLNDPDPAIRAAAVACLANADDEKAAKAATSVLHDMMRDADRQVRIEAARCLGAIPDPRYRDELIRLLYDRDWHVASETIAAVRRRVTRDGFNPLYVPTLISLFRNRRLKHSVREALVAFGEDVLPALVHFLNDPDEQMWVRRALPKTIASLEAEDGPQALLSNLQEQDDPFLRRKTIEALAFARERLADVKASPIVPIVSIQVHEELRRHCDCLAEIAALKEPTSTQFGLLEQLISERAASHLDNVFELLSLLIPAVHLSSVRRGLASSNPTTRGNALEFLDNSLDASMRKAVMSVLDPRTEKERLASAARHLGVRERSKKAVLLRCLEPTVEKDADWAFVAVAALLAVHNGRERSMLPEAEELAESKDAFVAETAAWVVAHLQESPKEAI